MIKREKYLDQIRPFIDSDLVKIITGIRRCGKSIILSQIRDEVSLKSSNIIYLDFEDRRTQLLIPNVDSLINYIDNKKEKEEKCYIFLDEIQNLKNWAIGCKTLRLENNSLFITGSNSKLLSSEFAKELSGRYVSFKIRPFVYKEAKEYATELNKDFSIEDYLIWGGFPKSIEYDGEDKIRYLLDLEETIIFNDLVLRYKIKKTELFRDVCTFVFRSNSRIISVKSITDYINKTNSSCSMHTVANYISYLEEAFTVDKIKQYSTKVKRDLAYYYKIYNTDVSFNSTKVINKRFDLDHNLENIVYNELLYKGYQVKVFDNKGKEIDFYAVKNGKEYYIQVAYSVVDQKAYDREFMAFVGLGYNIQKILITTDKYDYSTSMVKHITFVDFLLMNEL